MTQATRNHVKVCLLGSLENNGRRHLGFPNIENVFGDRISSVNVYHHSKFIGDRSKLC